MTVGSRWVLVPAAALLCSCGQGARDAGAAKPYPVPQLSTSGPVVARAGAVTITTEELGKRLGQQGPMVMDRMSDPSRRKLFLEEQVHFELLAQEAWSRKMQDSPEVIQDLKKAMVQRLIREEMERRTKEMVISEGDLQAAYAAAFDEYNKPETIRLSQIVRRVTNEAERKQAHALLERLQREIVAAEKKNRPSAFAEAAREHSQDEGTRTGGGELQFMNRKEVEARYGADVATAVFERAQVGDTVIADATDAAVLFKKTGLRRAVNRTLEMVKPQVRDRIRRERRNSAFEAYFAELEKKYGATYDLDALNAMSFSARTASAAAAPAEEAH